MGFDVSNSEVLAKSPGFWDLVRLPRSGAADFGQWNESGELKGERGIQWEDVWEAKRWPWANPIRFQNKGVWVCSPFFTLSNGVFLELGFGKKFDSCIFFWLKWTSHGSFSKQVIFRAQKAGDLFKSLQQLLVEDLEEIYQEVEVKRCRSAQECADDSWVVYNCFLGDWRWG